MKANEFVGLLFLARDMAHSVHLNTRSYAKHMALNDFYHNVIDLADTFAEAYQGRHGLMGPIKLTSSKGGVNIVQFLESSLDEIEKNRYKVCEKEETAIQNIIDEIVGQYLSTLYKLKTFA